MNTLEQIKNEQFIKEQFIKSRILDDTKDYGRSQFVDEIYTLQQENQQLKEIIKQNTILVKDEYGDYQECNINPLEMKQKYEKQVDNWNKLKQYMIDVEQIYKENDDVYVKDMREMGIRHAYRTILMKMQELEQGSDNGE